MSRALHFACDPQNPSKTKCGRLSGQVTTNLGKVTCQHCRILVRQLAKFPPVSPR